MKNHQSTGREDLGGRGEGDRGGPGLEVEVGEGGKESSASESMSGGKPVLVATRKEDKATRCSGSCQEGASGASEKPAGRRPYRAEALAGQWRTACSRVSSSDEQRGQVGRCSEYQEGWAAR